MEFREVKAKRDTITLFGNNVFQATDIKTMYEVNNYVYEVNLNYESNGVKKIYQFFSLLFYALNSKQIVVIDEIEMGLHPALVEKIIQLFQDRSINKYGSQLIFSTQSTTILKTKLLRRDQIYLIERNKEDFSTEIFPLSEIKGVRTTDNIERDYLNGLYVNMPSNRGWLDDLDG